MVILTSYKTLLTIQEIQNIFFYNTTIFILVYMSKATQNRCATSINSKSEITKTVYSYNKVHNPCQSLG